VEVLEHTFAVVSEREDKGMRGVTDLRFGTDTGQVARDERVRFASVELQFSQRVTFAGLLRGVALA
jgi:hypothetical protein